MEGFAFLIPASSASARSLPVPGTCDLTPRRTDASEAAAPCAWKGPHIPAPEPLLLFVASTLKPDEPLFLCLPGTHPP